MQKNPDRSPDFRGLPGIKIDIYGFLYGFIGETQQTPRRYKAAFKKILYYQSVSQLGMQPMLRAWRCRFGEPAFCRAALPGSQGPGDWLVRN
jgi:hypothetical protein